MKFVTGNLLEADVEAIVNTVNCVGVMGKGLALQFKRTFPANFKAYERACRNQEVVLGQMFVQRTNQLGNPKVIINFPTKQHWRSSSKLTDIRLGLADLVTSIGNYDVHSIAIPALGCGNGGLDWREVRPLIESALAGLDDLNVLVFEPSNLEERTRSAINTSKPRFTVSRALFVKALDEYESLDQETTSLEAQKLAYFLQEGGHDLKLAFKQHHYGPYAHNLNHLLERINGHFLDIGNAQNAITPTASISVRAEAVGEANAYLETQADDSIRGRLQRLTRLVDGFQSPYGMELLATVHWVNTKVEVSADEDRIFELVREWNPRKRGLFKRRHVSVALQRLRDECWLEGRKTESTGCAP